MIKGFYNEHEFYTFNYWESKLKDEVKANNKKLANFDERQKSLKECSNLYWDLKGISPESDNYLSTLKDFNFRVLSVLGYKPGMDEFITQEDKYVSSVLKISGDDSSKSLMGFMISENDEGDFEQPIYSEIEEADDKKIDDRDINEILNEDLSVDSGPKWSLVLAPNAMFLIEKSKWAFGRFLKVDWDVVFSQSEKEVYDLIVGLFSTEVLVPESGTSLHDGLDDESHRHAFAVTTELREGVRESIELLVNEIIYQKKKSHEKYLKDDAIKYAQELTHDALFYVYRLIFLLFLEAQGDDSDLLPLKSAVYRGGYSLDKLLETIFVDVQEGSADYEGYFLFESLDKIFSLIFHGFEPYSENDLFKDEFSNSGFTIKGLQSDLFNQNKMNHLKNINLRNGVLQTILKRLSLSTPKDKKSRRGRISYANLGINQLGAVYEGLLSYSGFFASEDLYALKPLKVTQASLDKGKELDHIYLATNSVVETYSAKDIKKQYRLVQPKTSTVKGKETFQEGHFVQDDSGNNLVYKKGSFVYRMAGRDRKMSASYYTPETLTKLAVEYALKGLFKSGFDLKNIWDIKILEPAMGSGAFINECVNQLADIIIEAELEMSGSQSFSPKEKRKRIAEIKYKLISENVYGVDLNPTAVELAQFSLWLNCINSGLEPPVLKNRLKVGNSIVGANFKKNSSGHYSWLLLDEGMCNYGKKLSDYDSDWYASSQDLHTSLFPKKSKLDKEKLNELQRLAEDELLNLKNNSDENSYRKLKLCADIWSCMFFLNKSNYIHFPKSQNDLFSIYFDILNNKPIQDELLNATSDIVKKEKFFHWELEFPETIDSGFDIIIGNPPWMTIEWQDSAYASDIVPIPAVLSLNAAQTRTFIKDLNNNNINNFISNEFIRIDGLCRILERDVFRHIKKTSKNTYKFFTALGLSFLSDKGVLALIQEDGLLEDKKSDVFRGEMYKKFLYHFQFQNEKKLFSEVGNAKRFSINVFTSDSSEINFEHIGNLFLPKTVNESYSASQNEELPLVKDIHGKWETKGSPKRIIKVDASLIKSFGSFLNDESSAPCFLNLHANALKQFVEIMGNCNRNIGQLFGGKEGYTGSYMFHETNAQDANDTTLSPERPESLDGIVFSGPHINTGNPLSQETAEIYKSKFSYTSVNLIEAPDDFIPRTVYKLNISGDEVDDQNPKLNNLPYRSYFRVITRRRINVTNERCLFTVIIPPGPSHINTISGLAVADKEQLLVGTGYLQSLVLDACLRLKNKGDFFTTDMPEMPVGISSNFDNSIARRVLALNGLTVFYDDLWRNSGHLSGVKDSLLSGRELTGFGNPYSRDSGLREIFDREIAMIENDVLVGLSFGLKCDELIEVYKILFPVLYMYDQKKGFDREKYMREAYTVFEERAW